MKNNNQPKIKDLMIKSSTSFEKDNRDLIDFIYKKNESRILQKKTRFLSVFLLFVLMLGSQYYVLKQESTSPHLTYLKGEIGPGYLINIDLKKVNKNLKKVNISLSKGISFKSNIINENQKQFEISNKSTLKSNSIPIVIKGRQIGQQKILVQFLNDKLKIIEEKNISINFSKT